MKAGQKDFASIAPRAAAEARVFFFCGPDEAGAHDAAVRIVSLLADPGERIEMSGAELKRDPVRLGDEARSGSLFGDARHIVVRAQSDEAHDAVQVLLSGDVAPCPVLIVATGATDKSRTAKLLAERKDALVAMFYPPELSAMAQSVRAMGDAAGLAIGQDMAERIARAAGLDSRLARSEVEKLALYLDASPQSPRKLEAEALAAVGAKTEDDGFGALVNAVLGGESGKIAGELRRMRETGLNPVATLLAFERRAAQLVQLAGKQGRGQTAQEVVDREAPTMRIFFKEKRDIIGQLGRWRGKRLERLTARLAALHAALMADNRNAELLLSRELADIARAAARSR